jgi:hypothetical protein
LLRDLPLLLFWSANVGLFFTITHYFLHLFSIFQSIWCQFTLMGSKNNLKKFNTSKQP